MTIFTSTSQTKLGYQDRGHTFSALRVLDDGACLTAERGGGRAAKGLVVRYENPFVRDVTPSVLYEAKDPLLRAAVGAGEVLFAVSSKKLHTNESGAWKAGAIKTTTRDGYFVSDLVVEGGEVWVADYYGFHRRDGKRWQTVFSSDSAMPCRMFGRGGIVYMGWNEGAAVWNGVTFSPISMPGEAPIHQPDITAADGGEVHLFTSRSLFRGTAAGFRPIELEWPAERDNIDMCITALGATYVATYSALYRLDGKRLVQVMKATGWIARACAGNASVLWIANGTELLCTNGSEWKVVRRALDT